MRSHRERGQLLLDLADRYSVLSGGEQLLEIGTGWIHWHSVYHRLFANARVTMFDVWDCRQFHSFQALFSDLLTDMSNSERANDHAVRRLRHVLASEDFEDVYKKLDLRYIVEESGSLSPLAGEQFDCVFSFHVLEHVREVERLVNEMFSVLRPGGVSIHQIGVDDHLTHFDPRESKKNYIRYSDATWKLFFENKVQYHNRLQPTDFLTCFEDAGFALELNTAGLIDEDELPPISPSFERHTLDDLRCNVLTVVHRKPFESN